MVIIVKKLVPVYSESADVPKKYKNLRKAVYVTSFKHLYPNIPEILRQQYQIDPDEKIVVFWMREKDLPHFRRFRSKFQKVYAGALADFGTYAESVRRNRAGE